VTGGLRWHHITTHFLSPFACWPAAESRPKPKDLWLKVVTSVQAALLAASKSVSFRLDFLRLVLLFLGRPFHPRRRASAIFLAALRSARLCFLFRLATQVADEFDPGAAGAPVIEGPAVACAALFEVTLYMVSRRSIGGRRIAACVLGRGWRGTGARIGASARRPEMRRSGGSKAPETPLGVLIMSGISSSGGIGAIS
jgi:hypothetical protein